MTKKLCADDLGMMWLKNQTAGLIQLLCAQSGGEIWAGGCDCAVGPHQHQLRCGTDPLHSCYLGKGWDKNFP
jgi:hypothetical protein